IPLAARIPWQYSTREASASCGRERQRCTSLCCARATFDSVRTARTTATHRAAMVDILIRTAPLIRRRPLALHLHVIVRARLPVQVSQGGLVAWGEPAQTLGHRGHAAAATGIAALRPRRRRRWRAAGGLSHGPDLLVVALNRIGISADGIDLAVERADQKGLERAGRACSSQPGNRDPPEPCQIVRVALSIAPFIPAR